MFFFEALQVEFRGINRSVCDVTVPHVRRDEGTLLSVAADELEGNVVHGVEGAEGPADRLRGRVQGLEGDLENVVR